LKIIPSVIASAHRATPDSNRTTRPPRPDNLYLSFAHEHILLRNKNYSANSKRSRQTPFKHLPETYGGALGALQRVAPENPSYHPRRARKFYHQRAVRELDLSPTEPTRDNATNRIRGVRRPPRRQRSAGGNHEERCWKENIDEQDVRESPGHSVASEGLDVAAPRDESSRHSLQVCSGQDTARQAQAPVPYHAAAASGPTSQERKCGA
jgi:hypothetical protein